MLSDFCGIKGASIINNLTPVYINAAAETPKRADGALKKADLIRSW
jgi:hypothetical protein